MARADSEFVSRRMLVVTGIVLALLLAGIILFFLFGERAEPLMNTAL